MLLEKANNLKIKVRQNISLKLVACYCQCRHHNTEYCKFNLNKELKAFPTRSPLTFFSYRFKFEKLFYTNQIPAPNITIVTLSKVVPHPSKFYYFHWKICNVKPSSTSSSSHVDFVRFDIYISSFWQTHIYGTVIRESLGSTQNLFKNTLTI